MMANNSVLTLVADHTAPVPMRNLADEMTATLGAFDCELLDIRWLKDDVACDITIKARDFQDIKSNLATDALLQQVDYCFQPADGRRKQLFLADMDSTIITVECIDEIADFVGLKAEVSEITEKAMHGELDFNDAFRARVAMLKGLRETVLEQVYTERVTLMPGAKTLLKTLTANGVYTALVSGGFSFFTSRVRKALGFHMDLSNELQFENGALSGIAAEPILNSQAKLDTLQRLMKEKSIDQALTMAVGDGANDIPMIQAAGLGVSYHAKPKAAAAADAQIQHGDLTTLLYFQGYSSTDFIQA
ncbi:phosphoserine phosphatase SerB [Sneathiella marina]|uniref:Phosphoserine phosphatase n=1 Tax=Sneathiella marina TaxID=2950108 RepID=A0ABY4WDT9_9PROT|nr:phosphoserine phosphatase SerB [Sneathiella marina]USG62786.1 phosphoserine phosphatase SerB [Sneathiella marina]